MAEWLATNQQGKWGYEGYIPPRITTLAESLSREGYFTAMSGKWHLGHVPTSDPSRRGFHRTFTLLEGVAPHFSDTRPLYPEAEYTYRLDGKRVKLPDNFYSTRFYTDQLIEFLAEREQDQPFFGYLAYTAPHDPLHVPDEWIDRYRGRYDEGYDSLRDRRLRALIELGAVPEVQLPAAPPWIRPWQDLSPAEQQNQSRRMELYAAMIEYMDREIGRLFAWLDDRGELDNTFVVFISDNGANGSSMATYPGSSPRWVTENLQNSAGNLGRRGSALSIGPGWAQASMAPFQMYKGFMSEGGIRVPAIIAGPSITAVDGFNATVTSVRDLAPTLLELAGVENATYAEGSPLTSGRSIAPQLKGESEFAPTIFVQELFNGKMVRSGPWKAMYQDPPFGTGQWQLFAIEQDATESRDLAEQRPEVLSRLVASYEAYAREAQIVEPPFKALDIINKTLDPNDLVNK